MSKRKSPDSSSDEDFAFNLPAQQPLTTEEVIQNDDDDAFGFQLGVPMLRAPVYIERSIGPPPRCITAEMQYAFLDTLRVDKEPGMVQRIENLEQKSGEWLQARNWRITGSRIGSIAGHNFFQKPAQVLKDFLWGGFVSNEAMQWGTAKEDVACAKYLEFVHGQLAAAGMKNAKERVTLRHSGLRILASNPIFAASPDGILCIDGMPSVLLEIKCPFSLREKKLSPGKSIYMSYFDQISLMMYIYGHEYANFNRCDFFQWIPEMSRLDRFHYNKDYTEKELIADSEHFYYERALPLFVAKQNGWLKKGEVCLPHNTRVEKIRTLREIIANESHSL